MIKKLLSIKNIVFVLMIATWVVMIVSQVHGASSSRFGHPLAWIHMTSCWMAEVFMLAMILSEYLSVLSQYRNFNRIALVYQSLGIMVGMIWAYDAPDWGAFWQWDFIENSALLIWIALLFSQNAFHSRTRFFWDTLILFLLVVQTLMLFGGLNLGTGSRHHYAGINHALIVEMIVWILTLAVCHWKFGCRTSPYTEKPGISNKLEVFSGTLMIGFILLSLITDVSQLTWVLGLIMAVIWILMSILTKAKIRWVLCALGLITLVWNFLLPMTVTDQWIKLDHEQDLNLYGIEVSKNEDCLQYSAWIGAHDQNTREVLLKYCHEVVMPQKPVDYIDLSTMQFYRIQALDYRAETGLLVRTKAILWDLLFKYWLVLLLGMGVVLSVRNVLRTQAECYSLYLKVKR